MQKEYLTFVRQYSDLQEGERELFVKDLAPGQRKYDTKRVEARLARSPEAFPDGDLLWVRSETGVLDPRPWGLKILRELPPFVAGQPWSDLFAAMKKKA